MAVIPMSGRRRESLGKGGARKSRAAGQIPGVMYGHGETPVPLAVSARDFEVALRKHKGGNAIVNLALDGGGEFTALIRAVQYDPVTHHVLHLDFQHISLTETVEVGVATRLVGLPLGVKDGGGILEHITREILVRCLPTAIPAAIDVDVAALNIGDSIHVRDLTLKDLQILSDLDATIAVVVAPTAIEEVVPVPGEVPAEPVVLTEKKPEGEAEEKGADKEKDKGKDKKEKKEKK